MRRYLQLVVVLIVFFSAVFLRHLAEAERSPSQRASNAGGGAPRATPTPAPEPASQLAPALSPAPTATPTATPEPTPTPVVTAATVAPAATTSAVKTWPTLFVDSVFRDGAFTGKSARTTYGNLQVQVVMQGGRIEDVLIVEYPLRTPRPRG